MSRFVIGFFLLGLLLMGCRSSRGDFDPNRKYESASLKKDLAILQGVLESHHPGLYWYQTESEWRERLSLATNQLNNPLTEPEFRKVLRPLVSNIRCGHTSVRASKKWQRYTDTLRIQKLFPISVKCWTDTLLVLGNLDPKDSLLVRGTQILSINGKTPKEIYASLFPYIFGDGFNESHKYQTLSGWGTFGNYYRQYLDSSSTLNLELIDVSGIRQSAVRSYYTPVRDTSKKVPTAKLTKKQKRVRRLEGIRSLQIDPKEKQALLRINSFSQNGRLRSFFRKGFKLLDQNNIEDLIIDVRNNGGGRVGNSTALTRYVTDRRFKIADSLYAVRRNSSYGKYIEHNLAIQASMPFLTRKRKDGLHHFGYFERHFFTPKKNNRFSGRVYILTGGNSFSATTLFVQAVKGQKNVTVIGEETGGGAYGNSAWEIPDVTLPHTGVRFRLPLFRMVMNKEIPNDGRGILPDVYVGSTVESVRRNIDNKMQVAVQLIRENRRKE